MLLKFRKLHLKGLLLPKVSKCPFNFPLNKNIKIMVNCKPYVVGIDCGGTNTVMGIADTRGRVVATTSIKTQSYESFALFLDAITDSLNDIFAEVGGPQMITGIGIGAPNANYYSGNIEYAANLPWKGVLPLADGLYERLGIPVVVTNDANAAAIGEMTYGAAKGMRDFIEITLGTGVGSGIVINGDLVYGHDGFAGELGHTSIAHHGGRACGCGQTDHLECYCSATGVARSAREFLQTHDEPSMLRDLNPETITSKDVFDAAQKGDKLALEIFAFTGKIMGKAFADFVAFSAPEAIILFGGLAQAGDLLLNPIVESMEENLLPIWRGKIKVIPSGLTSANAAILGAAALGWKAK